MKIRKMLQKTLMLGSLLLAVSQLSYGQESLFQVLAVDGSVQYKRAEEWQTLEAGASLMPQDMIKIDGDAYLGLVHQSGHTMELSKWGTYDVGQLSKQLGQRKREVTAKYAGLYVNSLVSGGTKPQMSVLKRSSATGRLNVYLPNSVDVFNDEVIVRWNNSGAIGERYEVKVKNMFNEVLDVIEVDSTKARLNFNHEKISRERMIIVSVNSKEFKDQKSNDYGMKQLTPEEAAPIARELNELKLEISGQQSALDMLILASFYEQNSLMADALTSYEDAIALEPDIRAFRTAYEQFIFRNGLDN